MSKKEIITRLRLKKLGLDLDLSGYSRPNPPHLFRFPTFSTHYRINASWKSMYKNFTYFYGNEENIKDFTISRILNLFSLRQRHANAVAFLNDTNCFAEFNERHKTDLAAKIANASNMTLHKIDDYSLEFLVTNFLNFRRAIRKEAKERRVVEIPDRKMTFIMLELNEDHCKKLNNISLMNAFVDLLENSSDERIYFCLFIKSASWLPSKILRNTGLTAFTGKENIEIARKKLYPKLKESLFIAKYKVIGVMYRPFSNDLIVIHPVGEVLEDWFLEERQKMQEINEMYKDYLDNLYDGTEQDET